MRAMRIVMIVACLIVIAAAAVPTLALDKRDMGSETLAPNDGWASLGTGTTGGSSATPAQIYTVHNRQELVAALNLPVDLRVVAGELSAPEPHSPAMTRTGRG